jgi:hypothetical protein
MDSATASLTRITRKEAKALGLTRYFTGKPCKRGHVCERYMGNSTCAECHRELIAANPEANRKRVLIWQKARPDKVSAKGKRSYAANLEKQRLRSRWKRAANIEALREYGRDFMRAHRLTDKTLIEIAQLNGLLEKGASRQEQQIFLRAFKTVEKQTNEEFEEWMKSIMA